MQRRFAGMVLIVIACTTAAPSEHEVRAALKPLALHSFAGVDEVFDIPEGKCSIGVIATGAKAQPYIDADDRWVVTNPARNAIVKVGLFEGTPAASCLSAVKRALRW